MVRNRDRRAEGILLGLQREKHPRELMKLGTDGWVQVGTGLKERGRGMGQLGRMEGSFHYEVHQV